MEIIDFNTTDSLINRFVAELRDRDIQTDRMRFRRNAVRIGEAMAYEISKRLEYSAKQVVTPLSTAEVRTPDDDVVLCTILRAGLVFHEGFLNFFDEAGNAFVSAYRRYTDDTHFDIVTEYLASPGIDGKTLIITDPMLATGCSMETCYHAMLAKGTPRRIHIASIIATRQAIDHISSIFPDATTTVWCAAIDPTLNEHSYIVPGLGDAGDLAYGDKD